MVNVITVEREYGSAGAEFAHHLAKHLGWRLVDSALVEQVAAQAGVSPELAASFDEQLDPWYHRVGKAFLQGNLQQAPGAVNDARFDSEHLLRLLGENFFLHRRGNRLRTQYVHPDIPTSMSRLN